MQKISEIEKKYKLFNDKFRVKCECGHSMYMLENKMICRHCGKYVFRNKEDEFKYRLNEKMLKNN